MGVIRNPAVAFKECKCLINKDPAKKRLCFSKGVFGLLDPEQLKQCKIVLDVKRGRRKKEA